MAGPGRSGRLYMAPEVLVGEELSARSDVYSLAATVWALLVGKPPSYDDPTPLAEKVPGATPRDRARVRAGLDPLGAATGLSGRARGGARRPAERRRGPSRLALSVPAPAVPKELLEAIVRTTAGGLEGAAASIALVDPGERRPRLPGLLGSGGRRDHRCQTSPGSGNRRFGRRIGNRSAIPDCRDDPRFAAERGQEDRICAVHDARRPARAFRARWSSDLGTRPAPTALPTVPPTSRRHQLLADLAVAAIAEGK